MRRLTKADHAFHFILAGAGVVLACGPYLMGAGIGFVAVGAAVGGYVVGGIEQVRRAALAQQEKAGADG